MTPSKAPWLLPLLLLLALISPLLAISLGSVDLPLVQVLNALWQGLDGGPLATSDRIVWELRLPRVLMAALCGAGLALAGQLLQGVTRNPLADPFLFGLASGATLGAVIGFTLGVEGLGIASLAFIGALGASALVMSLARQGAVERLVLAGVAVAFLLSAMANLLLYFATPQAMQSVLFWTLGSFSRAGWADLPLPALVLALTLVLSLRLRPWLTALLAGDESAHTQGVPVLGLRLGVLGLCALLTASLVAVCGSIGFVGLMIPHMVRLLAGSTHSLGSLLCALLGAVFMVMMDLAARTLLPGLELPVGVLTGLLGALFFLLLLGRSRLA